MNVAQLILELVGAVVVLASLIASCCYLCVAFLDWRLKPHRRSFEEGRNHERGLFRSSAYWFSESPETYKLIDDLASGRHVSASRECWRKARAEQEKAK